MIYALLLCTSATQCNFTGIILSYNLCAQQIRTGLEKGMTARCVRINLEK